MVSHAGERAMTDTTELEHRVRATSDGLVLALEELSMVEDQKRRVPPGDPRFLRYAQAVRETAIEVLRLSEAEEGLASDLAVDTRVAAMRAIEDTLPRAPLARILEEWRDVERQLEASQPGSPTSEALIPRFNALRAEYSQSLRQVVGNRATPAEPGAEGDPPNDAPS
jgi:hypothetical protein